jgi:presenilin-like A22 family membrane protease
MEPNNLNDNDLFEQETSIEQPSNNGSNNKPFIIGIGILGAIVVFSILAIIAYIILFRPKTTTDLQSQAAEINAQNTAIAFVATQTAEFEQKQSTQKAAPSTTSFAPSATAVVAMPTATSGTVPQATSVAGDPAIRTATVAAFQTQAAAAQLGTQVGEGTIAPQVTPTTLPTAGFMDDVGIPALLGAAIGLLIIIFFVRKLRFSSN